MKTLKELRGLEITEAKKVIEMPYQDIMDVKTLIEDVYDEIGKIMPKSKYRGRVERIVGECEAKLEAMAERNKNPKE